MHPIFVDGRWTAAHSTGSFFATNPKTADQLPDQYPLSGWEDCDRALDVSQKAFEQLLKTPRSTLAQFLSIYATKIEANVQRLADVAALETGFPVTPRLKDVELPRTINQLRQASTAASSVNWALPTIDTVNKIRSIHGAIGPVIVIGPNNFPFAYNAVAGGDFASAIAAGNPVIAKGHPAHPTTTRLLAELAVDAIKESGMPAGSFQLLYRIGHADGLRLVSDPRTASTGFTGSRSAGLAIKAACDLSGKTSYLEMSSVNPVVILPGAIAERCDEVVEHFCTSCLMGAGQFCTNPGLILLVAGNDTEMFAEKVASRFQNTPPGTLLTEAVLNSLADAVAKIVSLGGKVLAGANRSKGPGFAYENTLLRLSGDQFLRDPENFQTEMFGASSLLVIAKNVEQVAEIIRHLEGNLTGTIYSSKSDADAQSYAMIEPVMRQKVGRLNNDKMPTGVAVSSAMNHGGPYPSTGHAGFTAVGFPACVRRFSMLQCYDAVREERLPIALRNKNPDGKLWRLIDGDWSQGNI